MISVSFTILGGPKHWFELVICLGEPEPRPLHGYLAWGRRHPGFGIDIDRMWQKYPQPREDQLNDLLSAVSGFGNSPPIRITSLSRREDSLCEDGWDFKGFLINGVNDAHYNKTEIPVEGWFDIPEQNGEITFMERSR